MAQGSKRPVTPVEKPFLTGSPRDERTLKAAAGFLGLLLAAMSLTFLVCTVLGTASLPIRVVLNGMAEILVLTAFFSRGAALGTEAVARGEIQYQRQERGERVADSEKAMCFHPWKGFVTALIGSAPVLICALGLALTARRQMTGAGTLPSWISPYMSRADVGDALAGYAASAPIGVVDVLRIIIRIAIMPFISMISVENRDGLLLLERLSPVLVMLPGLAYGLGYLQGKAQRTKIHTGIAENNRRRAKKERKARKARISEPKRPEQLN